MVVAVDRDPDANLVEREYVRHRVAVGHGLAQAQVVLGAECCREARLVLGIEDRRLVQRRSAPVEPALTGRASQSARWDNATRQARLSVEVEVVTSSAINRVRALPGELRRFARLERILGAVLVLTPAVLIWADAGPERVRDSISAYHDVRAPAAFYVPLTVGAMLFIVNGTMRDAHIYNTLLGLALAGVILFDHDGGTSVPHFVFALAFFGGNVLVMMFLSTNKSTLLKVAFVGGIAVAIALWILTDFFTLFWAEWVSLTIIAVHYILDSVSWTQYRALQPNEAAKLLP